MKKNKVHRWRFCDRIANLFTPAMDARWEAIERQAGKFKYYDLEVVNDGIQNHGQYAKVEGKQRRGTCNN